MKVKQLILDVWNNTGYNKVKPIYVYGLRRSGNHAILNWMLANLGQTTKNEIIKPAGKFGFQLQKFGNAYHLNNVTAWKDSPFYSNSIRHIKKNRSNKLVISFEDDITLAFTEQQYSYSIVRDLPSLVASRTNKIKQDAKTFGKMMKVDEQLLDLWIQMSNHENVIIFEKWLLDKNYRDNLSVKIGAVKNIDMTKSVSSAGGGSSFIGQSLDSKENLLNRHKQINTPDFLQEWLKDERVIKIRKKFNYVTD